MSNETGLKLNLLENEYLDIILELEKTTGINHLTISLDDKETMKLIEKIKKKNGKNTKRL